MKQRAAGVLTDLWIVPEAAHTKAMFLDPGEYERRLGSFFRGAFEARSDG